MDLYTTTRHTRAPSGPEHVGSILARVLRAYVELLDAERCEYIQDQRDQADGEGLAW